MNLSEKNLVTFSIENIDDPCIVAVAVNLKEYFEEFDRKQKS